MGGYGDTAVKVVEKENLEILNNLKLFSKKRLWKFFTKEYLVGLNSV